MIYGVLFVSSSAFGQNADKIDSLRQLLNSSGRSNQYQVNFDLAFEYWDVDNVKALEYIEEAQRLSFLIGDSLKIVKSGRLKGQILRKLEDLTNSIEELSLVLPIAKRNKFVAEEKIILNALAIAHTFKAEYAIALKYNFESLVIKEREGDKKDISITLNNIGLVYFKLANYEKAIHFYNQAADLKKEIDNVQDLDRIFINIGLCYNQLNDFDKSKDYFDRAFSLCGENCSDQILVEGLYGLGVANDRLGKDAESKRCFIQSLKLSVKLNNKRFQAENLLFLGSIYNENEQFDSALFALQQAEGLAKSAGYNELLIQIFKVYSKLFNKTKNYDRAAFFQGKYIVLKDSIYSEQLIKNIAEVQTQYAERENIATIASNQQIIKQQRDLNIAVVVIAMLAGLLILVLQRSNRTIKRVNAQLSEAKEVIEEQNKQLEGKNQYLDREVEAKTIDLERANQSLKQVNDELDNFIYKTSHDIRGPLASLKGMCNVALMDVHDPVALDYLKKLDSTAERLNTILTRLLIINQINNSKLTITRIDFEGIVRDVLMLEKKKGLPQKLSITQRIENHNTIQSDKELIRIILENLIDNAIKFYNDSDRVNSFVQIHIDPLELGHVRIRVLDNGIGISESNPGKLFRMFFRASERSETGGIGLYIVKTATAKLGGKVGLRTTPEGYTEFYVDFPPLPPTPEEGPDKPSIY